MAFHPGFDVHRSSGKDHPEGKQLTLSFSNIGIESISNLQIDALLFSHPYRWIIFADDDRIFRDIPALPDSDLVIARANNESGFALKQFYKIEESSVEILHENYGFWSLQSGIVDERSTSIISRRRSNLRGKLITSSYVALNKNSKNHLTDYVDKNIDAILKLNYIILNSVLDKLNVTKKELWQGTWGYYNVKTKKWSGMVGDVVHKGADIGGKTQAQRLNRSRSV